MKYQITGTGVTISEKVTNELTKKLSRTEKFFRGGDNVECRVVVKKHKNDIKLEITIFAREMVFRAEAADNDLKTALDLAIDKLESQMRKLKARYERRQSREGILDSLIMENIEEEKQELENSEIVRTKTFDLKPMTIDEAILKMEAIGHSFFLYLDSEDELISVVYKRDNGGYGLLQAENKLK